MKKPNPKDFFTNDGMHAVMRDYAKHCQKPSLVVTVVFEDESIYETEFERAQEQVRYFTPDGDRWYQDVDSSKFINGFMEADSEIGVTELKKTFKEWVSDGEVVKSIKWKYVK